MATYLIGDVQGCNDSLGLLLDAIAFSPSRDTAYLLGDIVNRGPDSIGALRRCIAHEGSLHVLLGNHDLHLLATAFGVRRPGKRDTMHPILAAPDKHYLLGWVAQQPLARSLKDERGQRLLLVHAGVLPQWSMDDALAYAAEVQDVLRGPWLIDFLQHMYGNTPVRWNDALRGHDRLRTITNALTRLRFCTPGGAMDFECAESAAAAPPGLVPWFECPHRRTADVMVAFGHWSTLGLLNRANLMALDTGCVWGGCLSAMEISPEDFLVRRLHQISCPQSQRPG